MKVDEVAACFIRDLMDILFFRCADFTRRIFPFELLLNEVFSVRCINGFSGYSLQNQKSAVASDVIMNLRFLFRPPANCYEFVMLVFLQDISLIAFFNETDISLKSFDINLH